MFHFSFLKIEVFRGTPTNEAPGSIYFKFCNTSFSILEENRSSSVNMNLRDHHQTPFICSRKPLWFYLSKMKKKDLTSLHFPMVVVSIAWLKTPSCLPWMKHLVLMGTHSVLGRQMVCTYSVKLASFSSLSKAISDSGMMREQMIRITLMGEIKITYISITLTSQYFIFETGATLIKNVGAKLSSKVFFPYIFDYLV